MKKKGNQVGRRISSGMALANKEQPKQKDLREIRGEQEKERETGGAQTAFWGRREERVIDPQARSTSSSAAAAAAVAASKELRPHKRAEGKSPRLYSSTTTEQLLYWARSYFFPVCVCAAAPGRPLLPL
jgi:hypothetical protein